MGVGKKEFKEKIITKYELYSGFLTKKNFGK